MRISLKKEGISNIKALVLFLLIVLTIIALGVSMFGAPWVNVEAGKGLWVNLTNITDGQSSNVAYYLNKSEYLANTSFIVTIKLNGTPDNQPDLYYDVGATPNGAGVNDCAVTSADSGSGAGPYKYTIPAGGDGSGKCVITDGSVVAIAFKINHDGVGNMFYANLSATDVNNMNGTWNFTVDGAVPTLSTIKTPASNNTWVTSNIVGYNGSDSVADSLSIRLFVNNSLNVTAGSNITESITIMNASLTGLLEGGYYSVILEVADNVSNKLNSSPRTLWYDATNPTTADVKGISNGTTIDTTTIALNLSDGSNQSTINYTMYINGSVNVSGSANNSLIDVVNRRTTIALTGLLDGNYYTIYVAATDNASNARNVTGNNVSFVYDATAPTGANITFPDADNTWRTLTNITINGSDIADTVLNYTVYINRTANSTGANLTRNAWLNVPLTGLAEGGYYNLTVEIKDNVSRTQNSSYKQFWYDPTAPTIAQVQGISNGTTIDTTTITLNLSDGSNTSILNYAVYINTSDVWYTNVSGSNGNNSLFDITRTTTVALSGLVDGGYYTIYVAAIDNASNTRNVTGANVSFVYDATAPTGANITFPDADNTWRTLTNITINGSDIADTVLNYTVYINRTANSTGANLTRNAWLNVPLTGLAEGGYYNLTVEIKDNVSRTQNSSYKQFWYDPTAPTIAQVQGISNQTVINTMTISLNLSDGSNTSILNYAVYINTSDVWYTNVSGSNGNNSLFDITRTTTVALSGLVDGGYYTIYVAAIDNASNTRNVTANNISFWYDSIAPTQSVIVTPSSNGTWVSNRIIGFNGTDLGTIGTRLNYTIYINGTRNVTGSNLTNASNINVSMTGTFAEGGYYSVIVEIKDNASNALNSSPKTFYFDGTGPTISVVGGNGTTTTSRRITFSVIESSGVNSVNLSSITVSSSSVFNATFCTALSNGSTGYTCDFIENNIEVATKQFLIDGKDNASNSATTYVLAINTTAAYKYNVSLASGWNLISTPLILENTSVDNIVANNSNITKIYYYNASTWYAWLAVGTDDLPTMEPLKGYWVYTRAATVMQFFGNLTTGTPPQSYGLSNPRSLSASTWNLIGYYSTGYADNYNTDDALSVLCGSTGGRKCSDGDKNFDVLAWYDTAGAIINSTSQSTWDEDGIWDRGRGFWLHVTSADTLIGTP